MTATPEKVPAQTLGGAPSRFKDLRTSGALNGTGAGLVQVTTS